MGGRGEVQTKGALLQISGAEGPLVPFRTGV